MRPQNAFLLTALILICAALRLPTLHEPYWHGDEGITLTVGQAINQGSRLYKDIHDNKPPLLYYIAAVSHNLFNLKLLTLISFSLTAFFVYLLADLLMGKKSAFWTVFVFIFLSASPLFEGNVVNGEIWQVLPVAIGFYLYFAMKREIKPLLAGIFLGLGFMFKQPVIFDLFAVTMFILASQGHRLQGSRVRQILFLITGFLIPLGLFGLYFLSHNALADFFNYIFILNARYARSYNFFIIPQGLFYLHFLTAIVLIVVLYLLNKKDARKFFIFSLFVLEIFGALTTGRPYNHYLLGALMGFSLMVGLIKNGSFSHSGQNSGRSKFSTRITKSIMLLITVYCFYFFNINPGTVANSVYYYFNYASWITGKQSTGQYYAYFDPLTTERYKIYNYLKPNLSKNGKLFIWGDDSLLYPMLNQTPASGYITAYHVSFYNSYDKVKEALLGQPPKFIVLTYPQKFPFGFLNDFLNQYGTLTFSTENYQVYEINTFLR